MQQVSAALGSAAEHASTEGAAPGLDRSGQTWVRTFPRLGLVRVSAVGEVAVDVTASADPERAARALRYG